MLTGALALVKMKCSVEGTGFLRLKGKEGFNVISLPEAQYGAHLKNCEYYLPPAEQRYAISKISASLHTELVFWELFSFLPHWHAQRIL